MQTAVHKKDRAQYFLMPESSIPKGYLVWPLNTLVEPAIQKDTWRTWPLNTLVESYNLKGCLVYPASEYIGRVLQSQSMHCYLQV